jgi:hypothetical protein
MISNESLAGYTDTARSPAVPLPPQGMRAILAAAHVVWQEHVPLIVLALSVAAVRRVVWYASGAEVLAPTGFDPLRQLGIPMLVFGMVIFFSYHLARITIWDRATGGLLAGLTWRTFREQYLAAGAIARLVVAVLAVRTVVTSFAAFKSAIPDLHPFTLDQELSALDRWLHFGHDPWTLLHPMLGWPPVTLLIGYLYTFGWAFTLGGLFVCTAWARPGELRDQTLLAFSATWILLGAGLATLLSSAGPCFYQAVTGDDHYLPLMSYLISVDSWRELPAVATQRMLWDAHLQGGMYRLGITAMPSLHVAISALAAIAGWCVHRRLGMALAGFALLILLGSIHLGWHYAVDGYVSALAVPVIWWACGRLVHWHRRRVGLPLAGSGSVEQPATHPS